MACCLIVAYLFARACDRVRGLAILWGLRPAPKGWRGETLADRRRRRSASATPVRVGG